MCKRIAASLTCIALFFAVSFAVADDGLIPGSSLPANEQWELNPGSPPLNGVDSPENWQKFIETGLKKDAASGMGELVRVVNDPVPVVPAAPLADVQEAPGQLMSGYDLQPYLPAEESQRSRHPPIPPLPHMPVHGNYPPAIAPMAFSGPGTFTIITNGDSEILLDTRNGDTWRLINTADGTKWVEIKRDQKNDAVKEKTMYWIPDKKADAPFAAPATEHKKSDPFGPASDPQSVIEQQKAEILKLRAVRQDHIESAWQLQEMVTERGDAANEAKKQLAKSVDANESFIKRIKHQEEEIAELKKKLGEPAPDSE